MNYGGIVAAQTGVEVDGNDNEILNSGTISGGTEGINVDGTNNRVVNTGEIVSLSGAAVIFSSVAGETKSLFNSGTISGSDTSGVAIIGGDGDDYLTNQGTVDGHIALRDGNDVFIGTGDTINGSVFGGAGDDRLVGAPAMTSCMAAAAMTACSAAAARTFSEAAPETTPSWATPATTSCARSLSPTPLHSAQATSSSSTLAQGSPGLRPVGAACVLTRPPDHRHGAAVRRWRQALT